VCSSDLKDYQNAKERIAQRNIALQFVSDHLPANTFWLIDGSWQQAPYIENGIVYGLCYVHWPGDYCAELIKTNPNIMMYAHSEEFVRIWGGPKVPVDSIVITGTPIHLYSTYGRKTTMLMDILEKAAQRNDVNLSIDTIFSDNNNAHIIVMQNQNAQKNWDTEEFISSK
jgi:hypothetical protein